MRRSGRAGAEAPQAASAAGSEDGGLGFGGYDMRTIITMALCALLAACGGVADWLGINDGSPRLQWSYHQRQGLPKQYAAEVVVMWEL